MSGPAARLGRPGLRRGPESATGIYPYFVWDGGCSAGDILGFDTETALIADDEVPGWPWPRPAPAPSTA